MFGLGAPELILILLLVIVLFGGKKIPEIAKGLGKGIRDFKTSLAGTEDADPKNLTKLESKNESGNPKA